MWGLVTYQFPKFNGAAVEVWEWIGNSPQPLLDMWLYIHAGIKVNVC